VKRQDIWRLTVAYWPRATAAGLEPQVAVGFSEGAQFYRPHDIDFNQPPSREDFLAVVRQTPWMQVWQKDLLPVIDQNQWPTVLPGFKAAEVELKVLGKVVGKLRVRRQDLYVNGGNHAVT
jgi:hypothetical protein